jgi:phosphatidate cytidylyltransferase
MLLRTAVGLAAGVVFMICMMCSFWTALFMALVICCVGTLEFCRLKPGLGKAQLAVNTAWSSLVLVSTSLGLAGFISTAWIVVALGAVMIYYATAAVLQFERQGSADPWTPLRPLLFVTLPLTVLAPLALISIGSGHFPFLILLIGASWGADTGAIWAGKAIGRRKLAPRLSPNKTVEGLIGGLASSGAIWASAAALYPLPASWLAHGVGALPQWLYITCMFCAGALTALAGVAGDLAFSLFKRQAGIKDFSHIMPGHGGILDRVDSFIFVAPVVYMLTLL